MPAQVIVLMALQNSSVIFLLVLDWLTKIPGLYLFLTVVCNSAWQTKTLPGQGTLLHLALALVLVCSCIKFTVCRCASCERPVSNHTMKNSMA